MFSDIASIRFDSTGAKSVVIDNIPAGSRVIVKEVYAAGSYQVTSSDSIETQIVPVRPQMLISQTITTTN